MSLQRALPIASDPFGGLCLHVGQEFTAEHSIDACHPVWIIAMIISGLTLMRLQEMIAYVPRWAPCRYWNDMIRLVRGCLSVCRVKIGMRRPRLNDYNLVQGMAEQEHLAAAQLNPQYVSIASEWKLRVNMLYTLLQSNKLQGSQRAPSLRQFLLRLNFNGFQEREMARHVQRP